MLWNFDPHKWLAPLMRTFLIFLMGVCRGRLPFFIWRREDNETNVHPDNYPTITTRGSLFSEQQIIINAKEGNGWGAYSNASSSIGSNLSWLCSWAS